MKFGFKSRSETFLAGLIAAITTIVVMEMIIGIVKLQGMTAGVITIVVATVTTVIVVANMAPKEVKQH